MPRARSKSSSVTGGSKGRKFASSTAKMSARSYTGVKPNMTKKTSPRTRRKMK